MARLKFKDLRFIDKDSAVEVVFLRHYSFFLDKVDLRKIGEFTLGGNSIGFKGKKKDKIRRRFYLLLEEGFTRLKNKMNEKPTTYIHRNSGIPLIGHVSFGIIDRGTNVIEVKPQTGCNIKCIYCSVNEDIRPRDFVIEKDYLVEEVLKVIKQKPGKVDLHVGSSSEVFMYEPIDELVKDLAVDKVNKIAISTNGTYLTESRIDKLVEVSKGKIRLNVSLNAISKEKADIIAGCPYPVEHVKNICRYIQNKKGAELIIAPVWMSGINDDELELLVKFAKEINAEIMIQNFLNYKRGRNPVKEASFERFAEKLKPLEKKYNIKLLHTEMPETYKKTAGLESPFRKNQIVDAELIGAGRFPGEKIFVSENRIISTYPNGKKIKDKSKIKITRAKNNIFVGEVI